MKDNLKEPKEIDLIDLFKVIGRVIKRGVNWIVRSILFLVIFGIRNAHWILISLIIGILAGYLFFSNTSRYYSSDMIAKPNGIPAIDLIQYINDLGNFAKSNNSKAIALAMDQNDSIAMKLKSIQAYPYLDINKDGIGDFLDLVGKYNPMDTNVVVSNDRVYIQVEVFDNKSFNYIKQGLLNYLKKNKYFNEVYKLHIQNLKELILFTENELAKLDSLQDVDYFHKDSYELNRGQNTQLMFLSEKDKHMYYKDKADLINKKQAFEKDIQLADAPLTVIKEFAELTTEENTKGDYLSRFGFWFGTITYVLLLIIRNWRKFNGFLTSLNNTSN